MAVIATHAIDVRREDQGLAVGHVFNPGVRCQAGIRVDNRGFGRVAVMGQQGLRAVHEKQFGHGHGRVGGFEIAEFRFDVAVKDRPRECLFDGLFFHLVQEYIGDTEHIQMVDLARVDGESAITGPHGVAVGFFRGCQQMVGNRGVKFTVIELADNRHVVFFSVAVGGHHMHGRAFAHDISLGLFVEKAAVVVGQKP